jgi:Ca2+-binding RTX toxin-like protein
VSENAGQGKDTIIASVSYNLDSQEVEILSFTGDADLFGGGNTLANVVNGNAGDNNLGGWTGNDTLNGADGDDELFGISDNDVLNGGNGKDYLDGGSGNDKLNGNDGDDRLIGGSGKDTMVGGKGADEYSVSDVGDVVTEAANQGYDVVTSLLANYTLTANVENLILGAGALNGKGNALLNQIEGNSLGNTIDGAGGNDQLWGGSGNDSMLGGAGNDYLDGEAGDDTLKGGAGNELFMGGFGADTMYGEAGSDSFLYRISDPGQLATIAGDTIHGFQSGIDKIELADLLDEFGINPVTALAAQFVLLTKAGDDTLVQFDQDGVGGSAAVTLATVVDSKVASTDLLLADTIVL